MAHVKLTNAAGCCPTKGFRILIAVLCLAGCTPSPQPFGATPSAVVPGLRSNIHGKAEFLYVGGATISTYRLGEPTPVHTIASDLGTVSLALDTLGHLFAANGNPSWGTVTAYDARSLHLQRTINGEEMSSAAADRDGYLYTVNCGDVIFVFAPHAKRRPSRYIRQGVGGACTIAFDTTGQLYAANTDGASVSVYAPAGKPGAFKFVREITQGVRHPNALAADQSGNLFVSNCLSCWYSSPTKPDSVTAYASGSSSPRLTIHDGIDGPVALDVDSKGLLYVANVPFKNGTFQPGSVAVYAPGGRKPLRQITDGIDWPTSLALDSSNNLYVANFQGSSVTVYNPGGEKLLSTITQGVSYPLALAIGSQ
jgi:hypothetical protein